MKKLGTCTYLIIICLYGLSAQNLENFQERRWIDYSGNLSLNQVLYGAPGQEAHRDPYFWQLNGNLNFTVLELVDIPFQLSLTNRNTTFSGPEPFNRVGFSPSYRDLKLHLGYRSVHFSDYTLAGNQFLGAAVEYNSSVSPIRVKAVYGRFTKPVDRIGPGDISFEIPAYRRMGYGLSLGWEKDRQHVSFQFFKSSDIPGSIRIDSLTVRPEENLVLGVVTSLNISKDIAWKLEYAYSFFTRDILSEQVFEDTYSFHNNLGGLFVPNATSSFSPAIRSSVVFTGNLFQMDLSYRRVAPGYRTHGAAFLNNDLEHLTAGVTLPLLDQKLQVHVQAGSQRNNLDQQLRSQVRQLAFSSSISWNPLQHTMINVNFNNFNTTTNQTLLQADFLTDTLEYFQVSRMAGLAFNQQLGDGRKHSFFLIASAQASENSDGLPASFVTADAGFSYKLDDQSTISPSFSLNFNKSGTIQQYLIGPAVTAMRNFKKAGIRCTFNSRFGMQKGSENSQAPVWSNRMSASYSPWKNHHLSLNTFFNRRSAMDDSGEAFREYRVSVNYSYRFSGKTGKKTKEGK